MVIRGNQIQNSNIDPNVEGCREAEEREVCQEDEKRKKIKDHRCDNDTQEVIGAEVSQVCKKVKVVENGVGTDEKTDCQMVTKQTRHWQTGVAVLEPLDNFNAFKALLGLSQYQEPEAHREKPKGVELNPSPNRPSRRLLDIREGLRRSVTNTSPRGSQRSVTILSDRLCKGEIMLTEERRSEGSANLKSKKGDSVKQMGMENWEEEMEGSSSDSNDEDDAGNKILKALKHKNDGKKEINLEEAQITCSRDVVVKGNREDLYSNARKEDKEASCEMAKIPHDLYGSSYLISPNCCSASISRVMETPVSEMEILTSSTRRGSINGHKERINLFYEINLQDQLVCEENNDNVEEEQLVCEKDNGNIEDDLEKVDQNQDWGL